MARHTLRLTVPTEAIDENGHVNNVEYLRWMQAAAESHAEDAGGTAATRADNATWVVRSHHIEYSAPAFAGDQIAVQTWIAGARRASSVRRYEIRRADGSLLAKGETNWAYIDASSAKPRAIPKTVLDCFEIEAE